ncbi:MAG: peptidase M24 [Armatimonadota bacterium]|nr:MAG: peptidase M24 [Armatimonadota bacterium]
MRQDRLGRLRQKMAAEELEAFVVLDLLNVRWLSGFTGSSGACVVTAGAEVLFTDGRYRIQAAEECPGWELRISNEPLAAQIGGFLAGRGAMRVGFESDVMTCEQLDLVSKAAPEVTLDGRKGLVSEMRAVKDAQEVERIRRAAAVTDEAFRQILAHIRPGVSERDVALELTYALGKAGAERESFPAIVASGPRAALPHARPTDRPLSEGDPVLLDFGAAVDGYAADITRTLFLGRPASRLAEIYQVVLIAQEAALAAIRPGKSGVEVDGVARRIISEAGYGDCFGHGLGHMLGLDVHDGPALSPRSAVILQEGMVVTVEPGIYIEGLGGVRIEDDVVVTADGCEILTHSPKDLRIIEP